MHRTKTWLIGGLAGLADFGLYLAFTSNVGFRELIAAVITGGLAAAATIFFSTVAGVQFEFRLRDLVQAWRLPWTILADTAKILQALAMQLFTRSGAPSVLSAVVFDGGENKLAIDGGRRALAVTYNSATPNSIMLGIAEDQDLMIYHQLIPNPPSPMISNLGAKP